MLTKFDLYNYRHRSDSEIYDYYDKLTPVDKSQLKGFWKGIEIETGHNLNNTLIYCEWYGKYFQDDGKVHSLIFRGDNKKKFTLNPKHFPLNLTFPKSIIVKYIFQVISHFFETRKTTATVRNLTFRGVSSAAVVYDKIDAIAYLRRIDSETIIGVMESPLYNGPFFYLLEKEDKNIKFQFRKRSFQPSNI